MQQPLLPLFPLQVVLFPRTPLPLHIFEDRYKEMFVEILRTKSEFGVVLAGEKGIVNIGCTAVLEKVLKEYPDGRMDVLTAGRRRFEIQSLDEEKSYLRGAIDFFDDDEPDAAPAETIRKALEAYEDVRRLEDNMAAEPELSDPQLSFQLAQIVPDLAFRQALLGTRSEASRMKQLIEFLPSYGARRQHAAHIRTIAPRNGHAKFSPDV